MLKVKVFAVNPFREAMYVLSDDTKECIIIDCGVQTELEKERLGGYIESKSLKPVMALNTHCHVDHVLGISYLKKQYNIPFYASEYDAELLVGATSHAMMYGIEVDEPIVSNIDNDLSKLETITFGNTTIEVIPTPGHSKGSVSFFHRESGFLFTGDTLFKGSIGRTDLQGGDYSELMTSIITRIIPLAEEVNVTVYPGHGDHTTIAEELMSNPFITDVIQGDVSY